MRFLCRHLLGYKTFLYSMQCPERLLFLPKIQPCPLTTSPAAHNNNNNPATSCILLIPSPSKRSYGDSRNDTHFPRTSAPKRRRRLEEKGFKKFCPKGGGRNVSVISLSGSHECNITLNPNAAIPAQYFKRCLVLMPPC